MVNYRKARLLSSLFNRHASFSVAENWYYQKWFRKQGKIEKGRIL